jgi:hypothetical protein
MKKLNILDLHRNISQKQLKRTECFDKVLELCHKKIISNSDNKKFRVFYEVPDFILGYPLYDINDCIKYIMESLKNNGFLAIYYFPRYIYISWDFEEIDQYKAEQKKQKFTPKEKINTLDFKYKPSGKLTLDI